MIPDLRSSRGESTTSKFGFYPGHLEERLTGGTQRTTGLMVRYEVVKVGCWVERTLYVRVATLKFIRLWIGSQWRLERSSDVGTEREERVVHVVLAKAFCISWTVEVYEGWWLLVLSELNPRDGAYYCLQLWGLTARCDSPQNAIRSEVIFCWQPVSISWSHQHGKSLSVSSTGGRTSK